MVAYICEYTKNHWVVHFKQVNYVVCGLYLNKPIQKEKKIKVDKQEDEDSSIKSHNPLPSFWTWTSFPTWNLLTKREGKKRAQIPRRKGPEVPWNMKRVLQPKKAVGAQAASHQEKGVFQELDTGSNLKWIRRDLKQ